METIKGFKGFDKNLKCRSKQDEGVQSKDGMTGDFCDFLQDVGYQVKQIDEEADLEGVLELCDGLFTLKISYSTEKVEVKEYWEGVRKVHLPRWRKRIERAVLDAIRDRAEMIYAENAERARQEHEEECRKHEYINYAGTMSGN